MNPESNKHIQTTPQEEEIEMTKQGTQRMVESVRKAVHDMHEHKLADPQGSLAMEQILLAEKGKQYEKFVEAVEKSSEVLGLNEAEEAILLGLYRGFLKEEITDEGLQNIVDFIHSYRIKEESAPESRVVH